MVFSSAPELSFAGAPVLDRGRHCVTAGISPGNATYRRGRGRARRGTVVVLDWVGQVLLFCRSATFRMVLLVVRFPRDLCPFVPTWFVRRTTAGPSGVLHEFGNETKTWSDIGSLAFACDCMRRDRFWRFGRAIPRPTGRACRALPPGGVFEVATFATPFSLAACIRPAFTTCAACTSLFECIGDVLLQHICECFAGHVCMMQSPLYVARTVQSSSAVMRSRSCCVKALHLGTSFVVIMQVR